MPVGANDPAIATRRSAREAAMNQDDAIWEAYMRGEITHAESRRQRDAIWAEFKANHG